MLPSGCPTRTTYTSPGPKKFWVRGVSASCVTGTRLPLASRAVPRSTTQLRLCPMLNELCQEKAPRDTLTVDTDTSTPALRTDPMLRSWLEKPVVDGTVTESSRSLVRARYASTVGSTRFASSDASSPTLNSDFFSQRRSGLGIWLEGARAGISVLPAEYHAIPRADND